MAQKKTNVNVLQTDGSLEVVGTPTVTILRTDPSGYVLEARGATVPTDTDAGYAKGCIFTKTNGGVATTVYLNEGSETSADFNAVESSASTITSVAAGAGLTGGGTEGAVTLTVGAGNGITVNADDIALASSTAGDGLTYTTGVLAVVAGAGIAVAPDAVSLAASYTPTRVVKYSGKITWSGSGATLGTAVAGVLSTDIVTATVQTKATEASYLVSAAPTADTITLELSAANTSNDAVIAYTVFRAV